MKKLTVFASMLIAGIILPNLNAQQCSTLNLQGQYSFVVSGTLNGAPFNGAPFAAAGQTIYIGDGTASGVIQASVGGTVYPAAPWTATYKVSPMTTGDGQTVCVATKTIAVPAYGLTASFFFTAGDGYNELRGIATAVCSGSVGSAPTCNATNTIASTITANARKQ